MSSSSSSTSSSSSNSALSSFCSQSVIKDVSKEFIMRAKSGEWASVEQWRVNALVEDRARDTINVLLATGAIVRPKESRADGCDMLWVGLPGNSKREVSSICFLGHLRTGLTLKNHLQALSTAARALSIGP